MRLQILCPPAIEIAFILIMLKQFLLFFYFCLHLRSRIFIIFRYRLMVTPGCGILGGCANLGSVIGLSRNCRRLSEASRLTIDNAAKTFASFVFMIVMNPVRMKVA